MEKVLQKLSHYKNSLSRVYSFRNIAKKKPLQ